GLDPAQAERLRALVAARANRVPLQHLTGVAPFHGIEVAVGSGVFVPRPETELLVEWGLRIGAGTVVDLCAGSGAIALAVKKARPEATVYAVERDPAALTWLRRNAAGRDVHVIEGDVTDPATLSELDGRNGLNDLDGLDGLDGKVDLVLCNPPYVPAGPPVPPEAARFAPHPAV